MAQKIYIFFIFTQDWTRYHLSSLVMSAMERVWDSTGNQICVYNEFSYPKDVHGISEKPQYLYTLLIDLNFCVGKEWGHSQFNKVMN